MYIEEKYITIQTLFFVTSLYPVLPSKYILGSNHHPTTPQLGELFITGRFWAVKTLLGIYPLPDAIREVGNPKNTLPFFTREAHLFQESTRFLILP